MIFGLLSLTGSQTRVTWDLVVTDKLMKPHYTMIRTWEIVKIKQGTVKITVVGLIKLVVQ